MTISDTNFELIKELPINEAYDHLTKTPDRRYIYGGVAWPGKRAGYAIIVLMDDRQHFDSHDICVIAEFESFSTRDLVRQIGVMDDKFMPDRWIGDNRNDAADEFIRELQKDGDRDRRRSKLMFVYTSMLEMDYFYMYAMDEIKRLTQKERKMLYLKGSNVVRYMSEILDEEMITELKHGDYPAIEALSYAVITLMKSKIVRHKQPIVAQERKYQTGARQYSTGVRR